MATLDWQMTALGMEATDDGGYVYEIQRKQDGSRVTVTGPGHYWEDLGHFLTCSEAIQAAETATQHGG